jgi:hypothetical protein
LDVTEYQALPQSRGSGYPARRLPFSNMTSPNLVQLLAKILSFLLAEHSLNIFQWKHNPFFLFSEHTLKLNNRGATSTSDLITFVWFIFYLYRSASHSFYVYSISYPICIVYIRHRYCQCYTGSILVKFSTRVVCSRHNTNS